MADNIRYEIYDGIIYNMAPPSFDHQEIVGELFYQFKNYFEGKKCQAVIAPFNVNLSAEMLGKDGSEINSSKRYVFQPDISVICDPSKLNRKKGEYKGVPALVIEAGSPSTASFDLNEKKSVYEKAGVPEYWFVIDKSNILVHSLKDGAYQVQLYQAEDGILTVPSGSFPGLSITLDEFLFQFDIKRGG